MSKLDLDSILDQALDDFEELSLAEKVSHQSVDGNSSKQDEEEDTFEHEKRAERERMEDLLSNLHDPNFGNVLQSTLRSLSTTTEGVKTVDDLFGQLSNKFEQNHKSTLYPNDPGDTLGLELGDREIGATMSMLAQAHKGMEGFEPSKIEEAGESMMEDMIQQFEALGEKEDYNEVVDGVMRQLLSKDLMYEPTRLLCDKFPEWLATHRRDLSESEYGNYGKQYQTFQKILAVYDTEPDNFPRLMELMYDIQYYGQPPFEIIRDLAPGLKFDENGMPIMPNMGAGMMPEGMPGGEGLPNLTELSQQMAHGQCTIC